MIEFYAAVARKSVKGVSDAGWHPEQAVSREQALKMFTAWPAYAAFEENDAGTLAVGAAADFVLLNDDPLTVPPERLRTIRVLGTYVDGAKRAPH